MLKKCFVVSSFSKKTSAALFLLRLVAGLAFVFHGWPKIQNAMSWMGPEAPIPGVLQLLAAVSEFGGGVCWILGLLTPLASIGISMTMAVAVFFHASKGDPFVGHGGPSFELALVYLCIGVLFFCCGPGDFSADKKIFNRS